MQLLLILDLGTRWGDWTLSRPGCALARERTPCTHWIGGWMDLRAGLDTQGREKNPLPLPG
jgi:hypothetical protein